MPWLEAIVVLVIWRMVRGWRRSRRSAPDALSYRQSSRSFPLTGQRLNSLVDADPARVAHNGVCENCGVESVVPMRVTRLERRPWRLVWFCEVCGRQSRVACPPELVPLLASWDREGGTRLSMREVADMVSVDLDALNAAIEDELL
jgi:hypothetical protein